MAQFNRKGASRNDESPGGSRKITATLFNARVIDDFMMCAERSNGFGIYENDELAVSHAQTVSINQKRKYRRYGIVPASFIRYLKQAGVIAKDVYVPEERRTTNVLLDLLWKTLREGQGNLSEAEILRSEMLKELLTERVMEKLSGSTQHIYKKGELFCGAPKGQPDRKFKPAVILRKRGGV